MTEELNQRQKNAQAALDTLDHLEGIQDAQRRLQAILRMQLQVIRATGVPYDEHKSLGSSWALLSKEDRRTLARRSHGKGLAETHYLSEYVNVLYTKDGREIGFPMILRPPPAKPGDEAAGHTRLVSTTDLISDIHRAIQPTGE